MCQKHFFFVFCYLPFMIGTISFPSSSPILLLSPHFVQINTSTSPHIPGSSSQTFLNTTTPSFCASRLHPPSFHNHLFSPYALLPLPPMVAGMGKLAGEHNISQRRCCQLTPAPGEEPLPLTPGFIKSRLCSTSGLCRT